jgi:hypothetical protein
MSFSFGAASGAKASGGFSFGGAAAKPTAPATAAATSTAGGFSFGAKPAAAPAGTAATAATAPSSSAGAGLAFGGGALGAVAGANTTTGAAPASSSSSAAAGRAAGASGAGGGLKFGAAAPTVSAATAGGFSLAAPAATAGAAGGGALAKAPTVSFGPVTTMPAKAPPKPVHLPPAPPDLVSTDNTVKGQASNRSLLAVLRQCGGGDGAAGLVSKPWFIGRLESLTGVYSGPPVQGRPQDQTGRLPQPPESVVPAMRAKGQVYANVWAEVRGICQLAACTKWQADGVCASQYGKPRKQQKPKSNGRDDAWVDKLGATLNLHQKHAYQVCALFYRPCCRPPALGIATDAQPTRADCGARNRGIADVAALP